MRVFRNSITALTFFAIVSLATLGSGCEYVRKVIAKDKLNQGAILYNQGRIKQAQDFFKEATDIDPNNPIAWLYYGATLVKDYKVDNIDPKVMEGIANQALGVYQKALSLSNRNCVVVENAVSYMATIYDDLRNEEEWRKTMQQRAENECTTKEAKAQSYYSIAQRYWRCSYDQTTRYQDKAKAAQGDSFHYRNMDYAAAAEDKQKAGQCAARGLEYMDKALAVNSEYVDAMYYKGLLLREQQMLTKDEAKRKQLNQQAEKIANEASALAKKIEAAAAEQRQQEQAAPKG